LAGDRNGGNGYFDGLGYYPYFWSSMEYSTVDAFGMLLYPDVSNIYFGNLTETYGFSIRCLNNNTVGVEDNDKNALPKEFLLLQNYPNPFNPNTTINYQISKPGLVTLKTYDILGRQVATLINENKVAGFYDITFDASKLPSGVYIYQLKVNDFVTSKKMNLLK
jgi:hypothetical protein